MLKRPRRLPVIGIVAVGFMAAALMMLAVQPVIAAVIRTAALAVDTDDLDFDGFGDLAVGSEVYAANGDLIAEIRADERRELIDIEDLPDHVIRATLAAEDAEFYGHRGVDPSAIVRAAVRSLQGDLQGGSTITQQLAKLNFAGKERSLDRKVRELGFTQRLEDEYTKDELLERYLNQIYYGSGAYGIEAAAQRFFSKSAAKLTLREAAMLAGKIRAPEELDPKKNPEAVTVRRNSVLDAMVEWEWVTPAQADKAKDRGLGLKMSELDEVAKAPTKAPWFVELVKREIAEMDELGGDADERLRRLHSGGLVIETTLDMKAQTAAETAIAETLPTGDGPTGAVVTIEPATGEIRALVGGRDFDSETFDAATQGLRQPGSAFKPFVYLAAIRDGIHPGSKVAASSPMEFSYDGQTFEVNNYGKASLPPVDLDEALRRSVNTSFMNLGLEVGPETVVKTAELAGIPEGITPVPAVSLGGIDRGVSPLEMASAYATFANQGVWAQPHAITKVTDRTGEVIFKRKIDTDDRFNKREVGVLNNAMLGITQAGTGTRARIDRPVAGKTGTTSDYKDAWFVGYTAELATAVWVGHLDNRPMTETIGQVTGGSLPASIFAQTMSGALAGVEVTPLYTATPDSLGLTKLEPPTTTTSSTSSTSTTSTTEAPKPDKDDKGKEEKGGDTGRSDESTTTTQPPPPETTTTTAPPKKTTTTTQPESSTTTTTAPPEEN